MSGGDRANLAVVRPIMSVGLSQLPALLLDILQLLLKQLLTFPRPFLVFLTYHTNPQPLRL